MNEIYWITRLDGLNTIIVVCVVITALIVAGACFIWLLTKNDSYEEDNHKSAKEVLKRFFPALVISSLLLIFIPTKKDALLIWGIGGTIDYLKSNETVKKLPDKCIKALDKFVDEYMLDTDNNNKENAKD